MQNSENWGNKGTAVSYGMYDASMCNSTNLYRKQTSLKANGNANFFQKHPPISIRPIENQHSYQQPISYPIYEAKKDTFAVPDLPAPRNKAKHDQQQQSRSTALPFAKFEKSKTVSHQLRLPMAIHQKTPAPSIVEVVPIISKATNQYNSLAQSKAPSVYEKELSEPFFTQQKTTHTAEKENREPKIYYESMQSSSSGNNRFNTVNTEKLLKNPSGDNIENETVKKSEEKPFSVLPVAATAAPLEEKADYTLKKASVKDKPLEQHRRSSGRESRRRSKSNRHKSATQTLEKSNKTSAPVVSDKIPPTTTPKETKKISKGMKTIVATVISGVVAAILVFVLLALTNPTFVQQRAPRNVDANSVEGPTDFRKAIAISLFAGTLTATMPFIWNYVEPYAASWLPWRDGK